MYSEAYNFENYEKLSFLMRKKYLFEKNNVIKALKGGNNCF